MDIKAFAKNTIGIIIKCIYLNTSKNRNSTEDKAIEAIKINFRETIVPIKQTEQRISFKLLYRWDNNREDLFKPL